VSFEEKIESLIAEYRMEPLLSSVLVGFSGGADSAALLYYLAERAKRTETRVSALHVNHGIRGADADADEAFCRRTCEALGIPLRVIRADVPALAKEKGTGLEETARAVRYEAFARAREEDPSITAVATAHHGGDNVETVLLHLARGCGADGLTGIAPVNESGIIRPLLLCTREDIITYCRGNTISYVEDKTNADVRFARNRIRHLVTAPLRAINPGLEEAVWRMCRTLREDNAYLDQLAEDFCRRSVRNHSTARSSLLELPKPIRSRVLKRMYRSLGRDGLAYVHLEAIERVLRGERTDKDVNLPGGIVFSVAGDLVCFRRDLPTEPFSYPLKMGENLFEHLGVLIFLSWEKKKPDYDENIYKLSTYQAINFDKIKSEVFVRQRRNGDRYTTRGMTRSVKRWLCDSHFPRWERDRLPLLCDGNGIVWIPGMGLRDGLKPVDGCRTLHVYWFETCPREN